MRLILLLVLCLLALTMAAAGQDGNQTKATRLDRALVTICVDDGYASAYDVIWPIMKEYGFQMTLSIVSNASTSDSPGLTHPLMNAGQISRLYDSGNQIISHSASHPFLTEVSAAQLESELVGSKNVLNASYPIVDTFAVPYGAYDDRVMGEIKKYYTYCRTSDVGYNTLQSFDPLGIQIQYVVYSKPPATIKKWLEQDASLHGWLVILYHNVDNVSTDEYSTKTSDFLNEMQEINDSGLPVLTMKQALNEIMPQVEKYHKVGQ